MTERDYTSVTEIPGLAVSQIQLRRDIHRYQFASAHVDHADVLDAACGSGQGLGYVAKRARSVVGGDLTPQHLDLARSHYGPGIRLVELDAQALPFVSQSFDVVLLLEALYYLPEASVFFSEARRVLRPQGRLVISSVNPAWPDFARSLRSTRYLDSRELYDAMRASGFEVTLFGAFSEGHRLSDRVRSAVRRVAIRLSLIPGSLSAKALLKRFFYGPLLRQPAELPEVQVNEALTELDPRERELSSSILYAVGQRSG